MAKYVKNPDGGIHSVADDFEAPAEWGEKGKNWFELLDEEAAELLPHLFGHKDPAVEQARLTDERAADPDDSGIPTPSEPQPVDADGNLIPVPTDEGDPDVPAAPAAPADAPAEEAQA